MCNALPDEDAINAIDMDQINILWSNLNEAKLNSSYSKDQPLPCV